LILGVAECSLFLTSARRNRMSKSAQTQACLKLTDELEIILANVQFFTLLGYEPQCLDSSR